MNGLGWARMRSESFLNRRLDVRSLAGRFCDSFRVGVSNSSTPGLRLGANVFDHSVVSPVTLGKFLLIPEGSPNIGTQDMRRCSGVQVPYSLGKGAGSDGKGSCARKGLKEALVTDAT